MSEWWTYTLADFLMFAPRTYYRLFELYNAEIWPAQILSLALGLSIPLLLRWGGAWRGRAVAAILAVAWAWVAWGFHWRYFATINWPATWFAAGFAAEAVLLAAVGVIGNRLQARRIDAVGFGLLLFALLVQPLVGPILGRAWTQIELFGVAPDPTAVASLGALLIASGSPWRWLLLAVPLLWCAVAGATLHAMAMPDWFVLPLAGILTILGAIRRGRCGLRASPGRTG